MAKTIKDVIREWLSETKGWADAPSDASQKFIDGSDEIDDANQGTDAEPDGDI